MEHTIMTIEELCTKITDGAHNSPEECINGGYPMYSSKDMLYGEFDDSDVKRISAQDYKKLVAQDCQPQKNDILIIKDGANYLKYAFKVSHRLDAVILSSIAILRPNTNVIDPDYFTYLLRTNSIRQAMSNYVSGAAIPRIVLKDFKKMKLCILKDVDRQKAIAKYLLVLDSLIEVNNKRIKVLEQMAENLYKEWFVRFRFPGYENTELVETRLGKIPTSFSIVKMKDAFEYYIGGGWGNDTEDKEFSEPAYVIRGTDFPRVSKGDLSTCPLRYHKKSNYTARKLHTDDIILEVSGGTAEQPVGRVLFVTEDTIKRLGGKVICASFCKQIRVNRAIVSPIYFFNWMKYLYDTRIIDRFQLQSTGIINFQFEYFLRKGYLMLPPKGIMDSFERLLRPIIQQIDFIAIQNENLIKQRDYLLPRLMNGKIEV